MQIKTAVRYHLILVRIFITIKYKNNKMLERTWRKGNSCTVGRNVSTATVENSMAFP